MKMLAIRLLTGGAWVCLLASGQAPGSSADSAKIASDQIQALEKRVAAQRHVLHDWANLIRYGSENAEVRAPKPGEQRVVFLGEDTIENWGRGSDGFFPGKAYLNRGITGQTTPQMLVRFQQDVVGLKPKVVVIAAGHNDMAGNTGPITEAMTIEDLTSMLQIAQANHIRVVLASATPVCDCFSKQTGLRPQGKIIGLNGSIEELAGKFGAVYLNYYYVLAEGRNLKKELTSDGLHLNEAAYRLMAPLAEKAIAEALVKN